MGVTHSDLDVQYALENTHILLEPDRRIDTFGSTEFEFKLISELMDSVGQVRIRSGRIQAEKPLLVRPEPYKEFTFEGFGEGAEAFHDWLKDRSESFALLKYGFSFKKSNVEESIVHDTVEAVRDRVLEEARQASNPMQAVLVGVDDTWEICLLRFTVGMIQKSAGINIFDFKRRGML
jgi:hypothetical protein